MRRTRATARLNLGTKTDTLFSEPMLDKVLQPDKSAGTDEQNLFGVHLNHFLLRVFAPAARRYTRDGAFQNLEQCLLHTLTGDIAGNRRILGFAGDFINLVNIDDASLCAGDIPICRLQQLE